MFKDMVIRNRSYRKFNQNYKISNDILTNLVDLARLTASAANLQPLKYIICSDPETNKKIFTTTAWAGYLQDWQGPAEGEQPSAYIIILGDKNISEKIDCDHGIAAQTILLGAAESDLGGCMIGSIQRKKLSILLKIESHLEILLIIALGKPAEKVVLEDVDKQGSIKYYRDEQDVHHVPKRKLSEVIIRSF